LLRGRPQEWPFVIVRPPEVHDERLDVEFRLVAHEVQYHLFGPVKPAGAAEVENFEMPSAHGICLAILGPSQAVNARGIRRQQARARCQRFASEWSCGAAVPDTGRHHQVSGISVVCDWALNEAGPEPVVERPKFTVERPCSIAWHTTDHVSR